MKTRINRRHFLSTTALSGAGFLILKSPKSVWSAEANEKLNIGVIGAGGRGMDDTQECSSENIVALCDVDESHLAKAANKHPNARKYVDYRKLLDESKDLDAIIVATAEHTHAFATLGALQLGKHVYCEKPLTHAINEARIIADAAKNAKVATQMGTQIHSSSNYRRIVELIQTGAIGPVREAHVWVSRAWGWQTPEEAVANKDIVNIQDRPKEEMTPPSGLHWDLFIGPAPKRPFNSVYWPGPKWYRWWDFGSGTMSDLGSHFNDLPFWALNLRHPLTIESEGPPPHPEIAPASMAAHYEFGPRGDMPAVKLTWHQGTKKPRQFVEKEIPQWQNGFLFVGDKGMLLADYGKHVLLPENKFKDFTPPAPFIPDSPGHWKEWIIACKTGKPTGSHFQYGSELTIMNHLGNIAYRVGKKLEWDPLNLRTKNCPEADQLVHKQHHNGWKLA